MKGRNKGVWRRMAMVLCGLGIGAINGLLGGGGGMLTVPVLQSLGKLDAQRAHATAIAVMLPMSLVSAVMYTVQGIGDLRLGWVSCVAVTLGGAVGALSLGRVPKTALSILFYLLMLAAGAQGVWRCFG